MRRIGGLVAVAALGGCFPEDPGNGGQIGEEGGAHCEVVERTVLGRDEVSPLGFAPADVLAYAVGATERTLVYEGGGTAALTVTVTERGPLEFLHQELVVDGDGSGQEPAIEPACPDLVSVGVTVAFASDDGVFAESWDGALLAASAETAGLSHDLSAAAGTFDAWDHVPAGSSYDEVRAWLDLTLSAAGPAGGIVGQGSGIVGDPNDPDSMAFAESFDIASFGPAEE